MSYDDPIEQNEPGPAGDEGAAVPADQAPEAPEDARPSRTSAWIAMGAVAFALGLIWMAPGLSEQDPDAPPPAASSGESGGEDDDGDLTGRLARLDFTLKDMSGADVTLASFKGKVILLNFWATWCGPCRAEIPALVELQEEYGDDLVVLGFSVDDPVEKLKPYADDYKINYPVLVGNGRQDVQDAFGPLWGIPVSVIIDREGRVAKKHSGIMSKEQFKREIAALL
jgi:thiol-disulfide isomerase/thioredoxin